MNRRALLAGASAALLARSAESQPVPVGGNAGAAQMLGPGPLPAANQGGLPGPSLRLDFMNPGVLDPRITFTRASTATYTDISGTIQTAATNAPRWDYDPVTHALRGLLIEEARTNLLLQSQFAASWTPQLATLTPNAVTSPDGGTTAATLKEDNTSGVHYLNQIVVKAASPLTYTFSVYLKQGVGTRNLCVQIDNNGPNGVRAIISPANGAIVQDGFVLGTGWVVNPVIYTSLPGGWGRMAFTFTTASEAALVVKLVMASGGSQSYLGDNTSTIQLFGSQVEQAAFPSSYIPTTAAAVTRAFDNCFIAPANMSPWFVSPGGTWFAEFTQNVSTFTSVSSPRIIGIHSAALITPLWVSNNFLVTYDGVQGSTPNQIIPGAISKAASNWAPGSGRLCLNGGSIGSAVMNTGFAPLATSGVGILGGDPGSVNQSMNGYIRRVQYWPRVLSDVDMQLVTT